MRAIDLFAGAGGFTAGAEMAGARVVWAANHWRAAVECHAANHPHVHHVCQDLRQADFTKLPRFDLLLASPACQGHSYASQSKRRPKHDADRATAWAVVDCANVCLPRALIVENVPQFRRWILFPVWKQALEALGYTLTELVLDAADFGVPQERRRLFVVGLRKRKQLEMPPRLPLRVPSRTILDPRAEGWAPIASKSAAVRARIARGRANYGRRFLTQYVTNHPGRSLNGPIATVTGVSAHWHLVDGDMMRALTVRELARAQSFADSYVLPDKVTVGTRLVGNAVPPLQAAEVVCEVMEVA